MFTLIHMEDKKAAKKIIKRAKKHPDWYTDGEVRFAKMIKSASKNKRKRQQKVITDANDKDWEDFWNSMKEKTGLLQIFIILDNHRPSYCVERDGSNRTINSHSNSISSDSKSVLSYTKQSQREY